MNKMFAQRKFRTILTITVAYQAASVLVTSCDYYQSEATFAVVSCNMPCFGRLKIIYITHKQCQPKNPKLIEMVP